MNTERCVTTEGNDHIHYCGVKCISWSAIVIGALVALGLSFLLNLFSTAIGLSIYKVSPEGVSKLAVGGMLGFAIGIIASMFFAGWIAGYFGRAHCNKKYCGAVYGFSTWSLSLILLILLAMPFSRFITNYTNYYSHTISNAIAPEASDRSDRNSVNQPAVRNEPTHEALNDLSKGAFVLFLMFFLGATASTCGGHVGTLTCHRSECCNRDKNKI